MGHSETALHVKLVDGGIHVAGFRDRILLDGAVAQQIESQLLELAQSDRCCKVVIDFSNVQALSSKVLGAIISVSQQIRRHGGAAVMCNMSSKVTEVFGMMNLDELVVIHADQLQAIAALSQG